jgi:hypothetical protein
LDKFTILMVRGGLQLVWSSDTPMKCKLIFTVDECPAGDNNIHTTAVYDKIAQCLQRLFPKVFKYIFCVQLLVMILPHSSIILAAPYGQFNNYFFHFSCILRKAAKVCLYMLFHFALLLKIFPGKLKANPRTVLLDTRAFSYRYFLYFQLSSSLFPSVTNFSYVSFTCVQ